MTGRSRLSGSDPTLLSATEAGAGLSRYLHGHDLKVQADYFRVKELATRRRLHQARVQLQLFF